MSELPSGKPHAVEPLVLRILHVEDDPVDAELVAAALEADGLVCHFYRACSRDEFLSAIERPYDIILSDYSLPAFDGVSAQKIAASRRPDLPFVFVSGTMGEDVAIERLKEGATDYVLKQRLARLPTAVRRALQEARDRRRRAEAEAEVRRLNEQLERRVTERTAQLAAATAAIERREAELAEAKAFLEELIAASPSMIFRLEPQDLRFTYVSPNIGWLLGYSPADAAGPGFWEEVIHPADREQVLSGLRKAMAATVAQIEQEYRLCSKDGRYRWFFNLLRIDYDWLARPTSVLGYALDIEDRKAAEGVKRAFLSRMSHDLRTPLNAILGFAQLLEIDNRSPEQEESVRQILQGSRHLLRLINELLDVASIEAGRVAVTLQPVPVDPVVADILQLLRPLADARRIRLRCLAPSSGLVVLADRHRLAQILMNLVGNAVKYNCEGGFVSVSWSLGAEGRVRIGVTDSGSGIPADKIGLLFQPFERLGAERGRTEGTGLGLALSQGLAAAMGGQLSVTSEVGVGSTFWLELPASAAPAAAPPPEPRRDALPAGCSTASGTVLYIEDNPANVRLAERILSRLSGVRLVAAGTGESGLMQARTMKPDLILLDLHLPDGPGEDVLVRLRADAATRTIPIVVLSADAMPAQRDALLAAGAAGFLTKPLDLPEFLGVVDRCLLRAREEAS